MRTAQELVFAEEYARAAGWSFEWQDDDASCSGCDCDNPECDCSAGRPHETLGCVLRTSEPSCYNGRGQATGGAVLSSLWGICGVTAEYRRVVEAELALEAMNAELTVAR